MGSTRKCVVPYCQHRNRKNVEKRSMFQCPKDQEKARKWLQNIPGLIFLEAHQHVCEVHFEPRFIKRYYEKNSTILRARLSLDAVPTIFHNFTLNDQVLSTSSNNITNNYRASEDFNNYSRNHSISYPFLDNSASFNQMQSAPFLENGISNNYSHIFFTNVNKVNQGLSTTVESSLQTVIKDLSTSEQLLINIKKEIFSSSEEETPKIKVEDADKVKTEMNVEIKELTVYEKLENNINYYTSKLPESWSMSQLLIGTDKVFAFSKECAVSDNEALVILYEKNIVLNKNGDAHYSIHGKTLNIKHLDIPEVFKDIESLINVVFKIDEIKICQGICTNEFEVDKDCIISKDDLGFWRHVNCTLISDKLQCDFCYDYSQYLLTIITNNPVLSDRPICYYNRVC